MSEHKKQEYQPAEVEVIRFDDDDIITTSGGNAGHETDLPILH